MEYFKKNCKSCGISLSKFEEEEYDKHCIDCHKENTNADHNLRKVPVLIRSGRKRVFTA